MTRTTAKNRINKLLAASTRGLFSDDSWEPISATFKALRAAGFEPEVTNTRYGQDDSGNPSYKVWNLEFEMETGKPLCGVITAHGAGTVENPLSKYDISAYVC